jgi:hypothetical protein
MKTDYFVLGTVIFFCLFFSRSLEHLTLQAPRVYYKFSSNIREPQGGGVSGDGGAWGYRFFAMPMRGITWTSESQVLSDPSLEWACWLLELLLHDASALSREIFDAVRIPALVESLARYLRTPGSPSKGRVANLLCQLLHHPLAVLQHQRRRGASKLQMAPLLSMASCILGKAKALSIQQLQRSGRATLAFLPPQLQQLAELALAIFALERADAVGVLSAERTQPQPIGAYLPPVPVALKLSEGPPSTASAPACYILAPPLASGVLQPPDDDLPLQAALLDVADLCASFVTAPSLLSISGNADGQHLDTEDVLRKALSLSQVQDGAVLRASSPEPLRLPNCALRIPDALLSRVWLDSIANVTVVETQHPYREGESLSGWVVVPGASALRVALDRRSMLAAGCRLRIWSATSTEPLRFCGEVPSSLASRSGLPWRSNGGWARVVEVGSLVLSSYCSCSCFSFRRCGCYRRSGERCALRVRVPGA